MIKCHSAAVEYTQERFLFPVQSFSYYFARERERIHLMLLCHQVALSLVTLKFLWLFFNGFLRENVTFWEYREEISLFLGICYFPLRKIKQDLLFRVILTHIWAFSLLKWCFYFIAFQCNIKLNLSPFFPLL